jgi:hypothetical protein
MGKKIRTWSLTNLVVMTLEIFGMFTFFGVPLVLEIASSAPRDGGGLSALSQGPWIC